MLDDNVNNIDYNSTLDPDVNLPNHTNFKYYTSLDFNEDNNITLCSSHNYFSALHCNVRSLNANVDHLHDLLHQLSHNFSLIGISETKINSSSQNFSNINIPDYKFISQPSLSNAGGVGFYVNDSLNFILRNDLSTISPDFQSLWIEIPTHLHNNIICGVVYRHPHSDTQSFLSYLDNILDKINNENKYCMLMGDFNLNLLNYETHLDTNAFLDILASYFFTPHIIQPTRITDHSATLIDNIFFNSVSHHTISGNILDDLSDHLPNFIIVNKFSNLPKHFKLLKRDYSRLDNDKLIGDLQNINWDNELTNCSDASTMFDTFYSKISSIIDHHIPFKQLSNRRIKQLAKPWITRGIRKSINEKNKLYKNFIRTRSLYYQEKYKQYKNKLNNIIKLSKKSYYNDYFVNNRSNIKNIWKGIRSIVSLKPLSNSIPSRLLINDSEVKDSKLISNAFNQFFTNVGPSLSNVIPDSNISPLSYLPSEVTNQLILGKVSSQEISDIIQKLNPSKSTGPFSIPTNILLIVKDCLLHPLQTIFNLSFETGVVPNKFKIANVIPIFKSGSELSVNNYRPISLLSVFSRILEKLMFSRLLQFCDNNRILYTKQFGFRKNHTTLHSIISITDLIQKAIDVGTYSCGIYLDLSKAFDVVNHKILLKKLYHYGLRDNVYDWFKSYLTGRSQYVSIGNIDSDITNISTGVPQGSVLGPILFLLYINDFHHCSNVLNFHLFADDANLFYSNKKLDVLESTLNNELSHVQNWLQANRLSLNVKKSNFVIFHPPQKKIPFKLKLYLSNNLLNQVTNIKYLGVFFDENLNWKHHVSYIGSKIKRGIGMISKLRHLVPINILVSLYYSLIYPYLVYGVVAWGNTYETTVNPLFILQKRAIRLMTFSDYRDHSNPLFIHLNILKFHDLIKFQTAIFMHDFHHSNLPTVFNSFFSRVNCRHNYNTRLAANSSYSLPRARTNYGLFNIRFAATKYWNSLSENLKNSNRKNFKKKLFNEIILSYKDYTI